MTTTQTIKALRDALSDHKIIELAIASGIPANALRQGMPYGYRDEVIAMVRALTADASEDAPDAVLMPREATEEMMHAAEDVPAPRPYGAVYRAMVAARPTSAELETARLAAAHYELPERDIPALVAFERHRDEQRKIIGMPGLSALPCFIAGFHAGHAARPAPDRRRCKPCAATRGGDNCWKCGAATFEPHPSCGDDPALPPIDRIRELAREVGYAIGVHGSQQRDFDVIAAPWADTAIGNHALLEHIAKGLATDNGPAHIISTERKPLGRYAATIQMDGWYKQLDISVCAAAPAAPIAEVTAPKLTECRHCGFFVALNQAPAPNSGPTDEHAKPEPVERQPIIGQGDGKACAAALCEWVLRDMPEPVAHAKLADGSDNPFDKCATCGGKVDEFYCAVGQQAGAADRRKTKQPVEIERRSGFEWRETKGG